MLKILMLNGARKLIGEAAHTLDLTEELLRLGHDVRLVLRADCDLLERALARELPVTFTMKDGGSFHPVHSVREIHGLRRFLLNFKPDIVHSHRGNDHGLAVAVLKTLPPKSRPAVVRTRHRVVPVKNTIANRWLYVRQTHAVISVSRKAAQSFGDMAPLLEDKMRTILSSVDTQKFTPINRSAAWRELHGVTKDEPLIGLIARLQRVKGQRPFLEAAVQVAKQYPQAKFLIAGPGPDSLREKIRNWIRELGLQDKVILLSWLDDIQAATASLDVGVLASLGSEASSRIVYEYMSSGVPVVATSVGCIPEIVGQPKLGAVVPPGIPDAMATAICSVLASPELTEEMRVRARQHVELHHNRERWVRDTLQAYQFAMDRRAGKVEVPAANSSYGVVLTGKRTAGQPSKHSADPQ